MSQPPSRSRRFLRVVTSEPGWLLCAVLLIGLYYRTKAYVSAGDPDPGTYVMLARRMLDGLGGDTWSFVSPGFPLLLAGAMLLFGSFTPVWFNLPVLLACLALLARIGRELGLAAAERTILLLVTLWILVGGYPSNPNYLLYAYRGPSMTLFLLLGAWAWLRWRSAGNRPRRWLLLALCAWAYAGLIKETALLAPACIALWALWSWLGRWRLAHWVFSALAAGMLLFLFVAPHACGQFFSLFSDQGGRALEELVYWLKDPLHWSHEVSPAFHTLLDLTLAEFGGVGLFLLALGLVAGLRTSQGWGLLFVAPGLLFALLYVLMAIPYPRYFLRVIWFLAPVAGLGLVALLRFCQRYFDLQRPWLPLFACALLTGLSVQAVVRADSWDHEVKRSHVKTLITLAGDAALADQDLVVDPRARSLYDALRRYTDLPLREYAHYQKAIKDPARSFLFVQPVEEGMLTRGHQGRIRGVTAKRMIDHHKDIRPLEPEKTFWLGQVYYQIYRADPRTARHLRQLLDGLKAGVPTLCWFNFRVGTGAEPIALRIVDAAGQVLERRKRPGSRGWLGWSLHLPAGAKAPFYVEVDSEAPRLPARILAGIEPAARFYPVFCDARRSLAVIPWFPAPMRASPNRPYGIVLDQSSGSIRLPPILGLSENQELDVSISMSASRSFVHPPRINFSLGNTPLESYREPSAHLYPFGWSWQYRLRFPAAALRGDRLLSIQVDSAEELTTNPIRFHALSFALVDPEAVEGE